MAEAINETTRTFGSKIHFDRFDRAIYPSFIASSSRHLVASSRYMDVCRGIVVAFDVRLISGQILQRGPVSLTFNDEYLQYFVDLWNRKASNNSPSNIKIKIISACSKITSIVKVTSPTIQSFENHTSLSQAKLTNSAFSSTTLSSKLRSFKNHGDTTAWNIHPPNSSNIFLSEINPINPLS